jgi:hypothetical protein
MWVAAFDATVSLQATAENPRLARARTERASWLAAGGPKGEPLEHRSAGARGKSPAPVQPAAGRRRAFRCHSAEGSASAARHGLRPLARNLVAPPCQT